MSTHWTEWAAFAVKRLETMDNQSTLFTSGQNETQRVLAIVSSTTSIFTCLIAIYMFLAIDPQRLVFRHQLITFLIFFDLLKAVILLIFPTRIFTHAASYFNNRFCQVVGFFTATAIEGADVAILAFAIHTFLLIFKPSLTVKVAGTDRAEGGLYLYRYYVYLLSFVIPLVLASLPYIGEGYASFVCWCYLPQHPVWYRLVLSWVPRYCIIIIIFSVYCLIYFYVLREFRTLGGVFTTMHKLKQKMGIHPNILGQKPSFFSAIKYFWDSFKDFIMPQLILPLEKHLTPHSTTSSSVDPITVRPTITSPARQDNPGGPLDTEAIIGDQEIQAANLEGFRRRQRVIEKQMKSIFIYPFAYIFVWLFPFILQCTQFNYEREHHPIYWLNCMGAFMQPFNGVVDSLVFFYRERPWEYTVMKHYEREHAGKLDNYVMRNHSYGELSSMDTNLKIAKGSLSASMHVDVEHYSWWRQLLSKLRLPLMHLPTESNVERFLKSYINNRLDAQRNSRFVGTGSGSGFGSGLGGAIQMETEFSDLLGKHDFSNLLSGGILENDFRLNLDRFSFSGRRTSGGSGNNSSGRRPSVVSLSNKSNRSRRFSVLEGTTPIPENDAYVHGNLTSHKASTAQKSASIHPSDRSGSASEDTELDFLEFLRKGPK